MISEVCGADQRERAGAMAPRETEAETRTYAALALLLTLAVALVWSHVKLLWVDELLVLETDSAPTIRAVLHTQRTTPIALDPPGYHLVVHAFLRALGSNAFALRLPSLLGFLVMQVCLFAAVRRMAGRRAALVAMLVPALSGTMYYATETRPYGMLLGCFGVAAWSYCRVADDRGAGPRAHRGLGLVVLAASIGLALNTHYFGILLLLPLAAAEGVRLLVRRRFDAAVVSAIALGAACYLFTKPFQPGAMRYRLHYYNGGVVDTHALISGYRLVLLNMQFGPWLQRGTSLLLASLSAALLVLPLVYAVRGRSQARPHELALWITLALLPFAGVAIGIFVTHTFEVRYVLGAILGFAALFALSIAPLLRRTSAFHATIVLLLAGLVVLNGIRIRGIQHDSQTFLASLALTSAQRAMLAPSPGEDSLLYIQNGGAFQQIAWYLKDDSIRPRLALLYSFPLEMRYGNRDTNSLTAEHMSHFTGFHIVPWEDVAEQPGEHRLLIYPTNWDWIRYALRDPAQRAQMRDLGPALGGELYSVTVTPKQK